MKNIIKIIRLAKPLYHLVAALAILILITAIIELVAPVLSKFIVDEITANINHHGGDLNRLIFLIALTFLMSFVGTVLSSVTERIGDHFAGRLRQFLTETFYDKVLSLPQSYFDTELSGKIVNQLNRGISTIQTFINASTNFILPTFIQSIFTIIILAYYNIPTAIFLFILFPVYLGISYYSTKKWGEREVEKNALEDVSRGRMSEVVANIKLVKSYTNEQNEYDFISSKLTDINKIYALQSRTFHIFDFARNMSLQLVLLGINIIVFYTTFIGKLTLGEMVLILQLVNQARRPLFAMSFILTQVQMAESGSKEYFSILELPSREPRTEDRKQSKVKKASIEFKNVSFKYEMSGMVLNDVSFKLGTQEKVALVGPSGTGKTTTVNLILKLYEATSGDIFLNDQNYKELSHTFIRNNTALVFQENELFSSTIRENVSYGTEEANQDDVINALKKANAWEFVDKLPKGIDSEVGERGVRLSGGQKQRIQIARAILKDAPILILDEATSSLDARSEFEVQKALETLMKNRLVIIIAHRFSTIQHVDTVMVMDEGRIVDYGKPKELSTRPGIYSDLLRFQIEGNKKLLEKFELY